MDYKYAYFFGSVVTLVIWFILFALRKDLRKEMLLLSSVKVLLAPTNILYYGEYWRPDFVFDLYNFGIESIMVCFAYGGITGVVYEFLFRKTPLKMKGVNLQISKLELVVSISLGLIVMLILKVFTPLNIIYTSSTGLLIVGIAFIYFRTDLLYPSIFSAIITVVISCLIYWLMLIFFPSFFDLVWIPDTISNIRLLEIPIEEYYFHLAIGLCFGVMYEVGFGKIDRRLRKAR